MYLTFFSAKKPNVLTKFRIVVPLVENILKVEYMPLQ